MKIAELKPSWYEWVKERPQVIQDICKKYPPNLLYKLKPTGQVCEIEAYSENGTVRVSARRQYDPIAVGVFGINPEDLEECDLPDWYFQ